MRREKEASVFACLRWFDFQSPPLPSSSHRAHTPAPALVHASTCICAADSLVLPHYRSPPRVCVLCRRQFSHGVSLVVSKVWVEDVCAHVCVLRVFQAGLDTSTECVAHVVRGRIYVGVRCFGCGMGKAW